MQVTKFVRPFNEDGHGFIRRSAQDLLADSRTATIRQKIPRKAKDLLPAKTIEEPRTFSHYVMNLPASAVSFLPAFVGLYRGHEKLFAPMTDVRLPMIHVHCFNTKSGDSKEGEQKICAEISEQLGCAMLVGDNEMSIHTVRDVAPKKVMFCASFRLPSEVAFR